MTYLSGSLSGVNVNDVYMFLSLLLSRFFFSLFLFFFVTKRWISLSQSVSVMTLIETAVPVSFSNGAPLEYLDNSAVGNMYF